MYACIQGKSLSVICGALRWLEDSERRDRERVEQTLTGCDISTDAQGDSEQGSNGIYTSSVHPHRWHHSLACLCNVVQTAVL